MTAKEWALKLDGREIGCEVTEVEREELKKDGIVVVYGASDDLMEFEGAISDEVNTSPDAEGYMTAHLDETGLPRNECEDEDCPYFKKTLERTVDLHARWCATPEYSWTFETEIPHELFDIVEEGEGKFCRGIVFSMKDLCSLMARKFPYVQ